MISPPIHLAIKHKYNDILELLLNYKADPNLKTSSGIVPLITAINTNNDKAVKLLLRYGADPNIPNSKGEIPLFHAIHVKNTKAIMQLLKAGSKYTCGEKSGLHFAVKMNDPECCRLLMYGADLSLKDQKGRTALDIASLNLEDPTCELLLGCNPIPSCSSGIKFIQELEEQIDNEKNVILSDWEFKKDQNDRNFIIFLDDIARVERRLLRFSQFININIKKYERKLRQADTINSGENSELDSIGRILLSNFSKRVQDSKEIQNEINSKMYTSNGCEALAKWKEITQSRDYFIIDFIKKLNQENIYNTIKETDELNMLRKIQNKKQTEIFHKRVLDLLKMETSNTEIIQRIEKLKKTFLLRTKSFN